jgi:predicted ATPase/class 3 adenylate cyclase
VTKIFISYRRDDAAGYAGWLSGLLKQHFGGDNVFIDVESIAAGEDFVADIERAVGACDVLIALIGKEWLEVRKSDGTRRLDDPGDFLRLEIGAALNRNVRVIPALLHGATMPREEDLPTPLRPLARRNAVELGNAAFAHDVQWLVAAIERSMQAPAADTTPAADTAPAADAAPPPDVAPGPDIPPQEETGTRPHGSVRTCLIGDLRGYTRFTSEHGDEAAARLAGRFATLTEETVAGFGGTVIELRGDEVLAIFSSPRNALRAAVALQARCAEAGETESSLPLNVGVGLDAGEIVPVRDGYRGGALNRAARLCSLAQPGEVLATDGIVHLAGRTEGLSFVERGAVQVKGLAKPIRVLQVAAEGTLPDELPPLPQSVQDERPALPDEPTPFVGRKRELAAALALLEDPSIRLLTLTGPGGTGKSRLALRIARTLQDTYRDGVVFVPLAAVTDASLVLSSIAEALDLREEQGRPLLQTVIARLQPKHLLLVLDTMEHLLAAAPSLAALLDACHELRLLVTSRIPLHVSREHELPVPPLEVPPLDGTGSPESIERYESVALFVERAQAVKPDFRLTAANASTVAEICARLDGLPLAIELAAARIRLFPPPTLLQRLSNRLALLTGGARDRPTRQQTLRGTIDWSYSLLSPEEQTLFARLSVFSGGWTFEAAEATCFEGLGLDPLDGMSSLVEKSIVRQFGEEPRFGMLDTIREYAGEKLALSPVANELRRGHAGFFLRFVEDAESGLGGPALQDTLRRLEEEHDNLRAALTWLLAAEPASALRLAAALRRFWEMRGHLAEGRRWLTEALDRAGAAPPDLRARALLGAGTLARCQADFATAQAALTESLDLFKEAGDDAGAAGALGQLGLMAEQQGDLERALTLHDESLALRRAIGDTWGIATSLNNLGLLAHHRGDFARARDLFTESLTLNRRLDYPRGIRIALNSLGMVLEEQGEYDDAEHFYRESVEIGRELGDRHGIGYGLINLGLVGVKRRDAAAALTWLGEGLRLVAELGDRFATVMALNGLAQAALQCGEVERSAALLAATETLLDAAGIQIGDAERQRREASIAAGRNALGEPEFGAVWQAGTRLSPEEAIALGRDLAASLPAERRAPSPAG